MSKVEKPNPAVQRGYACYYDKPEGEDIFTKVQVTTRYAIVTGMFISTWDVVMYSHAIGFNNMMRRFVFHTAPLAAMAATFTVVSNYLVRFRGVNDEWNYFLGGLACGPIFAHYVGSKHGILLGGLALGTIGFIKKTGVDQGWQFWPDVPGHRGSAWRMKYDFTLAKDPLFDECEKPCVREDGQKK